MSRLTTEQVMKDEQTHDPNSIAKLSLDHKALSDVACLGELKNLERLDLGFNTLTSLEGLRGCVNLKWLSVVQNRLVSLKGIEGLAKLTVLNAGKNKLRSMDGVQSLLSLRALILNDNEIVSVCKLDHLKELNTVVLSRNPICEISDFLGNMKSISKLSLSNCQIQKIDSSLMSCIELKELRLAHNDITSLPQELAHNKKLQNLDLGNNLIARWSDLKVLESLVDLKNLNLHGNPISQSEKLVKKVRRLLPRLQIFNAKPIDRSMKIERGEVFDEPSLNASNKLKVHKEKRDKKEKSSKSSYMVQKDVSNHSYAGMEKESKRKRKGMDDDRLANIQVQEDNGEIEKKFKNVKTKKERRESSNSHAERDLQPEERSDNKLAKNGVSVERNSKAEKKSKKKFKEQVGLDVIDDKERSFQELFTVEPDGSKSADKKNSKRAFDDPKSLDGIVINHKEKKPRKRSTCKEFQLTQELEVGMGGPSTWD